MCDCKSESSNLLSVTEKQADFSVWQQCSLHLPATTMEDSNNLCSEQQKRRALQHLRYLHPEIPNAEDRIAIAEHRRLCIWNLARATTKLDIVSLFFGYDL